MRYLYNDYEFLYRDFDRRSRSKRTQNWLNFLRNAGNKTQLKDQILQKLKKWLRNYSMR